MPPMYPRRPVAGFGKRTAAAAPSKARATPRSKPLKRPVQARAKFTVQAIYDAFVRIWRTRGWEDITTRAVALETGISVGTLYDYFPNKDALLSGYVRHCMDCLLQAIREQAITPTGLSWRERVHQLVRLTCGVDAPELPWFDPAMLQLEGRIAEPKHHRRVYDELSSAWAETLQACTDLPAMPTRDMAEALYLSAWGGRRYLLLVGLDEDATRRWVAEVERMCCLRLQDVPSPC